MPMSATMQADLTLGDCLRLLAEAEEVVRVEQRRGGPSTTEARKLPSFRDAKGKALFWKKCGCENGQVPHRMFITGFAPHNECNCSGKILLPEAEATIEVALAAARSVGIQIEIEQHERRSSVWVHKGIHNLAFLDCDAGEERLACYRALVTALVNKKAREG